MIVVLAATLISIVEAVAVAVVVVATASVATTTLVPSATTASSTATTVAPSLSQFRAMIRTVAVVIAVLPLVMVFFFAATTTTDVRILLASLVLVVIPLLSLLLLGGLSIRLLIASRLVPLDWLAVRDTDTLLLLPVIAALHERCNIYYGLSRIRWVSRSILELVLVISRVHTVNDKFPFLFAGDTCGSWDLW